MDRILAEKGLHYEPREAPEILSAVTFRKCDGKPSGLAGLGDFKCSKSMVILTVEKLILGHMSAAGLGPIFSSSIFGDSCETSPQS